jgi:hypothetical protein
MIEDPGGSGFNFDSDKFMFVVDPICWASFVFSRL